MTAAFSDPLVGSVIGGRYEVIRKVARGGMGTIYEVRNTKLGRNFALKTITAEAAQNPEVVARFRREADVVAKLSHPHVVEVVDWDQLDDGAPYLVMEYLRGETLAQRIEAVGPLGWPQIARIADQMLSALAVAHHAGVIHRDLKPQNIFLATDDAGEERVKLLDFGISKIRDSQTFATTDAKLLGTPAYMAPEQAEGEHDRLGPATDVWAIGAILYEMITGQVAFAAPSAPAILYRVCHGRPTPAHELRPDLPAELGELVDWTLDNHQRLDDVEQLRDELRRVLGKLAGVVYADSMRSRIHGAVRPPRRTPLPMRLATPEPAMTVRDPRPRRVWPYLGGALLAIAAGVVTFVLLRDDGTPAVEAAPVAVGPPAQTPAPTEAAPDLIAVTITSTPPGADVYRMPTEAKVGTTPWTGKVPRANGVGVFVLKAAGYLDGTVEVALSADGNADVALEAKPAGKPPVIRKQPPPVTVKKPPQRQKGEPVNPFGGG